MVAGGRRRGSTEIGCPQLLLVQVLLRSRQCSRQVSGSAISVPDWCLAYDSNDDEGDSGSETEVIEEEARANEDTAPIVNIFKLLRNPAFIGLDGNNDDGD